MEFLTIPGQLGFGHRCRLAGPPYLTSHHATEPIPGRYGLGKYGHPNGPGTLRGCVHRTTRGGGSLPVADAGCAGAVYIQTGDVSNRAGKYFSGGANGSSGSGVEVKNHAALVGRSSTA